MRWLKRFAPLCMIAATSILMGNSQLSNNEIYLNSLSELTIIKANLSLDAKENLGNIIILPEESFDQVVAAAMIERLNHLPSTLLYKVQSSGIKVKLFTGKLTDNKTAKKFAGIIPRGYTSKKTWDDVPGIGGGKVVLVKIGASEKGKGHSSVNLEYHELAHSIDYKVLNDASTTEAYRLVWNEEKGTLFPNRHYFLQYAEEYFAETFAMFYIGGKEKEKLLQLAPKTYRYIASIQ
ncbi:toxin [Niallia sp. JL1B1071]|uniref:anthrax toxin lethal factor-related metalloendopeptidase n=1 Tax=Niallia tiangongensis TaxID=3237105 RepID=UPI0037DCA59E